MDSHRYEYFNMSSSFVLSRIVMIVLKAIVFSDFQLDLYKRTKFSGYYAVYSL